MTNDNATPKPTTNAALADELERQATIEENTGSCGRLMFTPILLRKAAGALRTAPTIPADRHNMDASDKTLVRNMRRWADVEVTNGALVEGLRQAASRIEALAAEKRESDEREAKLRALCEHADQTVYTTGLVPVDEIRALYPEWEKQ